MVSNMTNILNVLTVDSVEKKRRLVASAAHTMQKQVDDANTSANLVGDDKGKKEGQARRHANSKAQRAYPAFKEETWQVISYLEGIGFNDMENKLYSEEEIRAFVDPINERDH